MKVIIQGDCQAITRIGEGKIYNNAPDDILKYAGEYTIISEELQPDSTYNAFFQLRNHWQEPNWNYRIKVTTEQLIVIADQFPEMLVALNTEPKNPKYKEVEHTVVYLNSIGDGESYIFNQLGITIENKPDDN
jgi:hypothetical protein